MQAQSRSVDLPAAPSSPEQHSTITNPIETNPDAPGWYRVTRRNGEVTGFNPNKIRIAIAKAFLAVEGAESATSGSFIEIIDAATHSVVDKLHRRKPDGGTFHIEDIQDQVELCLVRAGHYQVARAYMLYRETRSKARAAAAGKTDHRSTASPGSKVKQADSSQAPLSAQRLLKIAAEACTDLDYENVGNNAVEAC